MSGLYTRSFEGLDEQEFEANQSDMVMQIYGPRVTEKAALTNSDSSHSRLTSGCFGGALGHKN
jgi:hypothetical protein